MLLTTYILLGRPEKIMYAHSGQTPNGDWGGGNWGNGARPPNCVTQLQLN